MSDFQIRRAGLTVFELCNNRDGTATIWFWCDDASHETVCLDSGETQELLKWLFDNFANVDF